MRPHQPPLDGVLVCPDLTPVQDGVDGWDGDKGALPTTQFPVAFASEALSCVLAFLVDRPSHWPRFWPSSLSSVYAVWRASSRTLLQWSLRLSWHVSSMH